MPKLAAISYLMDGLPIEVFVSKTANFDSKEINYGIADARVVLYENNQFLSEVYYDPDYLSDCSGKCGLLPSRYISTDSINVKYGSTYRIEVEASAYPLLHSEEIIAERNLTDVLFEAIIVDTIIQRFSSTDRQAFAYIDSIYLQYNLARDNSDVLTLGVYDNRVSRYATVSVPTPESQYRDELPRSNVNVKGYSAASFSLSNLYKSSFTVEFIRYPPEFTLIYDRLIKSEEDIAGLYASSPTPAPTNMLGGYGYFVIAERYAIQHVVK